MRRLRAVCWSLACVGLAAATAPAEEEGRVLVDEWVEHFQLGEKISWEHRTIRLVGEGVGRRYVVEVNTWWPWAEGTTSHRNRFVSDAEGRILEGEVTDEGGPAPGFRMSYTPREDGGLDWTRARAGAEQTGSIVGPVVDRDVVALRLANGELPPGSHTLRVRRGSGEAHEITARAEVDEAAGRVVLVQERHRVEYEVSGGLIRAENLDLPGHVALPATAEEARDPARRIAAPEVEGVEDGALVAPELRLARPGPGWTLQRRIEGEKRFYGIELSSTMAVVVFAMPVAPPLDADARRRFGESLARSFSEATPYDLSNAEPVDFRGRPGVHLDLGGVQDLDEVTGDAWLVPGGSGGLLVLAARRVDVDEAVAAWLEDALERLVLVDAPDDGEPEPTRRITLKELGLSLEAPTSWTESETEGGVELQAPGGVGRFSVRTVPGDFDGRDAIAERLAQRLETMMEGPEVEVGEGAVGGWPGAKVTASGEVRHPNAAGLTARVVHWVLERPGGTYLLLTAFVLDGSADAAAIDLIVESVQWLG